MTRPASRPDRVTARLLLLGLGVVPVVALGVEEDGADSVAEGGTELDGAPPEPLSRAVEPAGLLAHAATSRLAAMRRMTAAIGAPRNRPRRGRALIRGTLPDRDQTWVVSGRCAWSTPAGR